MTTKVKKEDKMDEDSIPDPSEEDDPVSNHDEDDEEEDEENNNYEYDDFVVGDEDMEEEG